MVLCLCHKGLNQPTNSFTGNVETICWCYRFLIQQTSVNNAYKIRNLKGGGESWFLTSTKIVVYSFQCLKWYYKNRTEIEQALNIATVQYWVLNLKQGAQWMRGRITRHCTFFFLSSSVLFVCAVKKNKGANSLNSCALHFGAKACGVPL